jgi:hypothetical protein
MNSAYPAGLGTYLSSYDSIHIVPIAGPDPDFIRVWDARFPSDDNIDNDYPDDKHVFIDLTPVVKTKINNIQTVQLEPRTNTNTQVDLAMISGNNVKLLPIESNDENFLMVYSTIQDNYL